ncbi:Protein of unknown function [Anaplasma phagocytophilum]|uniref:Uncharacterized protein n=1 Tax=Anaplasma phagocytophilum TaxID=948 RepID=A0A098EGC1_ANAPH|nr:Protein of unknown function [Anaplasma phagocytophilum]
MLALGLVGTSLALLMGI